MRLVPAIVSASALVLASCAAPHPGPNVAASQVQAPQAVVLATKPTLGQEAGAVANDAITIDFLNGSATLSPRANAQLDVAARLFRDANPVEMFVAGHSDSVGDEYSNLILSAQRAQTVKKALAARGIPADRLLLEAYGEARPVEGDNPTAPQNRRVVVTWRLI